MKVFTLPLCPLALAACAPDAADPRDNAIDQTDSVVATAAEPEGAPPPTVPELQPITFADIESADLFGVGCTFHRSDEVLLILKESGGAAKIDGEIIALMADTASPVLQFGARSGYRGGGHMYAVTRQAGDGDQIGMETLAWPATLAIDGASPIAGQLQCGS